MTTENQTNALPPVDKITDLELAKMYAALQRVNEKLSDTEHASIMTKADKAIVLMAEVRDLLSMQCSLIHNLKAEISRMRLHGFAAE
jgi:hypothetical protein